MDESMRRLLQIPASRLDDINAVLLDPNMRAMNDFLEVVGKYGTPYEINRKAEQARRLPALLEQVKTARPEYLADLEWLEQQRDRGAFITISDYRRKVLGPRADLVRPNQDYAVTLDVSAAQYFPWVITAAKKRR